MPAQKLLAEASGLRHLRWAREILGSLEAHYEHDPKLSQAERELLLEEAVKLRVLVNDLSKVVKVYRDFLERERTKFRGMLRVGQYLVATARGSEERDEAEAVHEGLSETFRAMESKERTPRRLEVRDAVAELRQSLEAMDRRLAPRLPAKLLESLYPALSADGSRVADDGDGDDDAAG